MAQLGWSFIAVGHPPNSKENTKGTLEAGKLTNLVSLDNNLLTVDPKTFKDIKIINLDSSVGRE